MLELHLVGLHCDALCRVALPQCRIVLSQCHRCGMILGNSYYYLYRVTPIVTPPEFDFV